MYSDGTYCLLMGKQNATLTFPAFDFDVEKIVVYGHPNASGVVTHNIFVGATEASSATTGSKDKHTYVIQDEKQAAGTIYTYKVTNANNDRISKIEIYEKASSSLTPTAVSFGKEYDGQTVELIDDETFEGVPATLTPTEAGTVTYSSDNEDFAIVAADGKVTLNGFGTATITASFAATEIYAASSASYTIRRVNTAIEATALVFDKEKGAFDKLGTYSSSNTAMNGVTLVDINGVGHSGFKTTGGKDKGTNGNLQLQKNTGRLTSPEFTDFASGYTVKITYSRAGSTAPTLQSGSLTAEEIKDGTGYYVELSVPTGAAFELKAGNAMYISRIEITPHPAPTTATISISEKCKDTDGKFYGTYSNASAFMVPADLTVSEISVIDGQLLVEEYKAGDIVPANTGVMVSATEAGNHQVTLSSEEGTSVLGTDNMLKATAQGIDAADMAALNPNCIYYRLTMHNDVTIGFFWGAPEGTAFSVAANKAYLAVPAEAASRVQGFALGNGDDTTGIGSIPTDEKAEHMIYNLHGQRVAHPAKGIYIIDGRKIFVK